MTTAVLTKAEMRERIEEIAMQAFVPPAEDAEPLAALIARVRDGVEDERRSMNQHLADLIRELDSFAAMLTAPHTHRPHATAGGVPPTVAGRCPPTLATQAPTATACDEPPTIASNIPPTLT